VYLANAEAQAKRFRRQLDLTISKAGWPETAGRRVLEVGAGLGFFLDICEERGLAAEGCDTDPRRVEYANRGRRRVRRGTLDDSYAAVAFDAVFAFNLIEHLAHPREFLLEARRVLKPGGVLALETPIQESLFHALARVAYLASGGRLFLLAFSRRTFKAICGDMGFAAVYQRNVGSPFGEIWGKSFMMPRGRRVIYRLALPLAWAVAHLAGGGNRLFIVLRKE
jgi:2-polyprenyl-3-methyl-5-hydroxy-6-metoxy-1,4-benzoquinol methylase